MTTKINSFVIVLTLTPSEAYNKSHKYAIMYGETRNNQQIKLKLNSKCRCWPPQAHQPEELNSCFSCMAAGS